MKRCCVLSMLSVSIVINMILHINVWMWFNNIIDLCILNSSLIAVISPAWYWWMIFLMLVFCWGCSYWCWSMIPFLCCIFSYFELRWCWPHHSWGAFVHFEYFPFLLRHSLGSHHTAFCIYNSKHCI